MKIHIKQLFPRESGLIKKLALADSFLLTIALGAFVNDYYQLRQWTVVIILFALLFSGVYYFFDRYKKNLLCYFVLLGIFILIALISYFLKINYIRQIRNVYVWCLTYDGGKDLYVRRYGLAVTAFILLIGDGILYPIHHYKKVKEVLAVILMILLIIAAVNEVTVPKVTVFIVLFYFIVVVSRLCSMEFYKNEKDNKKQTATLYLAPVCFLIALSALLLPSEEEPIGWKTVKLAISNLQEKGSIWMTQLEYFFDRTGSDFALSYTGYSEKEERELGGEIRPDTTTTLMLEAINKSTAKGYLIGSIRDIYTGRKWESSNYNLELSKEDYYYDFYELLKALTIEAEKGTDISNFVKPRDYTVIFHDIRTRSIFFPLKTYNIILGKKAKYSETPQGAFLFKRAKSYGTKYDVLYYEMNLNNEAFQNMLRRESDGEERGSEESLLKVAAEVFDYNTSGNTFDITTLEKELKERRESIKKNYTALPETVPNRVKELALALTKEEVSDYDKLKSIEAYLNSLTYSTKMEKTPKEEDFVDYFLFQQQRGYCTYFASAFGVMARCIGIPTRYVEGYVVDYKDKKNSRSYKVFNSNAHSWVEAYIEGIGWIPFEPTPGFYEGRYTAWKDNTQSPIYHDSGTMPISPTPDPNAYSDILNGIANDGTLNQHNQSVSAYALPVLTVILCILFLFIIIFAAYYYILEKRYKRRLYQASSLTKLNLILSEVLRYLEMEGFKLSANETLLSYEKRIGDKIILNKISLRDVVNVFMKARYGEKDIKPEDLSMVNQFCFDLKEHLTEKRGKRAMFFDRFLFLHFYQ